MKANLIIFITTFVTLIITSSSLLSFFITNNNAISVIDDITKKSMQNLITDSLGRLSEVLEVVTVYQTNIFKQLLNDRVLDVEESNLIIYMTKLMFQHSIIADGLDIFNGIDKRGGVIIRRLSSEGRGHYDHNKFIDSNYKLLTSIVHPNNTRMNYIVTFPDYRLELDFIDEFDYYKSQMYKDVIEMRNTSTHTHTAMYYENNELLFSSLRQFNDSYGDVGTINMLSNGFAIDMRSFLEHDEQDLLILDNNRSIISYTRNISCAKFNKYKCDSLIININEHLLNNERSLSDGNYGELVELRGDDGMEVVYINRIWFSKYDVIYMIGMVKRSYFYERIEQDAKDTLTLVIIMIISFVIFTIIMSTSISIPLMRLAKAFNNINDNDINISKYSRIYEFDSLNRGYHKTIELMNMTRAYLPGVRGSADSDDSMDSNVKILDTCIESPSDETHTTMSEISDCKSSKVLLKIFNKTTSLMLHNTKLEHMIYENNKDVDACNINMFEFVYVNAKACRGYIHNMTCGDMMCVIWNGSYKSRSIDMAKICVNSLNNVKCGLHHCQSYTNVIGNTSQKLFSLGRTLYNISSLLAIHNTVIGSDILLSQSMIDDNVKFSKIDVLDVSAFGSRSIKCLNVYVMMEVDESQEWMYVMEGERKNIFLNNYFSAYEDGDYTRAIDALDDFKRLHGKNYVGLYERLLGKCQQ